MRCAFFFFQAEDGIRDGRVTGVQTCALPIWSSVFAPIANAVEGAVGPRMRSHFWNAAEKSRAIRRRTFCACRRSEERRVGKECRSRWAEDQVRKEMYCYGAYAPSEM